MRTILQLLWLIMSLINYFLYAYRAIKSYGHFIGCYSTKIDVALVDFNRSSDICRMEQETKHTDLEKKILKSLDSSHWNMRTIEGVAKELTETPEKIASVIRKLMRTKDVIEITDWRGNWYYTTPKKYNATHSFLDKSLSAITGIWRY